MEEEKSGHFWGFDKPYMRLYEEEEESLSRYLPEVEEDTEMYGRPAQVTLHAVESQSVWSDPDTYRLYHVMRFFGSLEGFYTGDLDLTGRHLHRFIDLSSSLIRFMKDVNVVRKSVKLEYYEDVDWDGQVKTFEKYVMTDPKIWDDCRLQWKLPRIIDFARLNIYIENLGAAMKKADGIPKIQKLCMMDLPPELIDHIFSFTHLRQARLLASTCQTMKNIGVSQIYHTRFVELRFANHEIIMQMLEKSGDLRKDFDKLAKEQSGELIRHVGFLVSRPDLTDAIQNLTFSDSWRLECRITDFRPYTCRKKYYGPINTSLDTLLASCQGLTYLSIGHFAITGDWLRTISQLPKLYSLVFRFSFIDDESVEDDILNGRISSSPQVLNFLWHELRDDDDLPPTRESNGHGVWYTLLLFPSLITFNHISLRRMGAMRLPAPDIQESCNHLCRGLRRITLDLTWVLVPSLIGWINSSQLRTLASCTLSHFKLRTDFPLPDDIAIPLLESLRSAPLEVLVLEGIKEGSLRLLERIVQLFPGLLGLTLVRRENQWQWETKLATWPHQSGEYASLMDGFHKLKYFGWNFRVAVYDTTPFDLLFLEATALKEAGCTDSADGAEDLLSRSSRGHRRRENYRYFMDVSSIALPFASFCPTLEMMGLEDRMCRYFTISRGSNGEVSASGGYDFSGLENSEDWNPESGWRPVVPSKMDSVKVIG